VTIFDINGQGARTVAAAHEGKAIAVPGDVMHEEDVRRGVSETVRAFGGLDIVVNNAGIVVPAPWRISRRTAGTSSSA